MAIQRATKFAIKTSFSCVIIESDIGHIIDDVKHLSMAMKSCKFHHTKREASQVAHTLARNAIHFDIEMAWIEEIPPCVSDVIRNDAV